MITRDDYHKTFWRQRREAAIGEARQLAGAVHAAAVSASALTGNPDFDRFLSYLQAALEGASRDRQALLDRLSDPMLVDPTEVARTRAAASVQATREQLLKHVIALPRQLIEQGDKARGLLELLKDDANGEPADAA